MIWGRWKKVPRSVYSARGVWCMSRPYCKWALHNCAGKGGRKTHQNRFSFCSRMKNSKGWKSGFNEFGQDIIFQYFDQFICHPMLASGGNLAGEVRGRDVFRAPCHMPWERWSRLISGELEKDPDINHSRSPLANGAFLLSVFPVWMEFLR